MEIYAVVDRVKWCGDSVLRFMESWFGMPKREMAEHLYKYEDGQAIRHLFRVASGLDSMVIGETQILGQVRDAFLLAQAEKKTGTIFNTLFKQAITFAKRAQSGTSIGENPVSVSYAAVELGKRIFGHFRSKTVLIVGAGKMSELTVKHLHASGAEKVLVLNRTLARAQELADKIGGTPCDMGGLEAALERSDIVISSTGAADLVLTKSQVEAAMHSRKSRPLFMIDIAVPRDLDPAISELSNVYLYDIDDLQHIVETNLAGRREEAKKIEEMIADELAAFDQWYRTLGVSPLIKALQHKAEDIHEATMESMLNKLPDLSEREVQIIRKLTKSMLNQMTRDPIVRIKELAAQKDGEQAVELFKEIFALDEALNPERPEPAEPSKSAVSPRTVGEPLKPARPVLQPGDVLAGT